MATIDSVMIRASAGSGKTWQLANRFLALVVLGVRPERIIALTFTRKAAGEFSDRILTMLADGAASESGAKRLAEQMRGSIEGDVGVAPLVSGEVDLPEMSIGFFQIKLEEMTRVLDRLSLSTLDSFFVRIVKQFTFELGLAGFTLLEGSELEKARMDVLNELFSAREFSEKSSKEFLEAFKLATMGNEETRLSEILKEFVYKYHIRWLKSPDVKKWGNEEVLWNGGMPWNGSEKLLAKADRAVELLGDMELHGTLRKSMSAAVIWLGKRVKGSPLTDMPSHVSQCLESIDEIRTKEWVRTYSRKEYVFDGEFLKLLDELLSSFVKDELDVKFDRTRGVFDVIDTYERLYERQVRGKGKLGFADLGLLLAGNEATGLWDSVTRELVDFRFDGRFDHWMLDEFQDTSRTQWEVVKNLVDEIMQDQGGERSLFVVGDKKQGIYGWRGGEPELFGELANRYGDELKNWPMDRSYRSAPEVLELLNTVCDPKRGVMGNLFPKGAVDRWQYGEHESAVGGNGHAWVCQMEKGDGVKEMNHAWVGELVSRLDPVRRQISCAVLVRKNSEAQEIGDYLREHYPKIPVALDSEVKVAEDHPTTVVLTDAFRFLAYPRDTLAWMHVKMSPLGKVFCTDEGEDDTWYKWTKEIASSGVSVILRKWIDELEDQNVVGDYARARLIEMERAAMDFDESGGSLVEWLEMLEAWRQKEVTRAGVVQIMTVFKAKGLGFEAVILPDFGRESFDSLSRLEMLEDKQNFGNVRHHLMAPKSSVAMADSVLREQVERWKEDQCYEAFCVLYVALSRAAKGIYCLLAPASKSSSTALTNGNWIRSSVEGCETREEKLGELNGEVLFEAGNWEWLSDVKEEIVYEEETVVLPSIPIRKRGRLASDHEETKYGDILTNPTGMSIGTKVHQCFESIEWYDRGVIEWNGDKVVLDLVRGVFENDNVRDLFSKKEHMEVYREQPVEFILDGEWVSGVIDRMHVRRVNGIIEEIIVIDFKTDVIENKEDLKAKYIEQVEMYKRGVTKIFDVTDVIVSGVLISTHLKCFIVC